MRPIICVVLFVFVLSVIGIQQSEGKKGKCKCRVSCRSKEEVVEGDLTCGPGKNGEDMIRCCKKPKGSKKPEIDEEAEEEEEVKQKKPKKSKAPSCDCKNKCSKKEVENGDCVGGQKYCCKNWDF